MPHPWLAAGLEQTRSPPPPTLRWDCFRSLSPFPQPHLTPPDRPPPCLHPLPLGPPHKATLYAFRPQAKLCHSMTNCDLTPIWFFADRCWVLAAHQQGTKFLLILRGPSWAGD